MEKIEENVELLYKKVAQYSETSIELLKLQTIEKTANVISSLCVVISILFIIGMFILFVNIGISFFIGNLLENAALGFVIVSGFYLILGIIVFVFRKSLIKIPIENLIISKIVKEEDFKNE
jgi:hypothetical protein